MDVELAYLELTMSRLGTLLLGAAMLAGGSMAPEARIRRDRSLRRMMGGPRKPKNLNNEHDRAPGMKPFYLNAQGEPFDPALPFPDEAHTVVWAGTLRGAIKKHRLLTSQPRVAAEL